MIEKMTGSQLRFDLSIIRSRMIMGEITISQAKSDAVPYLDEINKRGKEIAKEYGKKHYPITFSDITR